MKYPGMPAAGSDGESAAWRQAGLDLRKAATQLRPDDFAMEYRNTIARYEVDARVGRREWTTANLTDPGPQADPMARLALAYARYVDAIYKSRVKDALRIVKQEMEPLARQCPDNVGFVDMATARIGRLRGRRLAQSEVEARRALESFVDRGMVHETADARRELAAVLYLRSDADGHLEARALAEDALATHETTGDAYLAGYAQILIARYHLTQREGVEALNQFLFVASQATAIGSMELYETACYWAGAAASGALHATDRQFEHVIALSEEALQMFGPQDRFSQAEMLVQIARLERRRFELDAAAARLDEAEMRLGEVTGGLVVANIAKERSRIELARAKIISGADSISFAEALRTNPAAIVRGAYHSGRAYTSFRWSGFGGFATRLGRSVYEPIRARRHSAAKLLRDLDSSDLSTETQIGVALNHSRAATQRGDFPDAFVSASWASEQARFLQWPLAMSTSSLAIALARAGMVKPDASDYATGAMRHLETLRVALVQAAGRSHLQEVARSTYLACLAIAAQFDDWAVAIEAIERQQSERLAGALRADTGAMDERQREAVDRLDAIDNERLCAVSEEFRGPITLPESRGRAKERQRLAEELGSTFVELFDPEPLNVESLYTDLGGETHTLHLFVESASADTIFCVWRGPDGNGQLITVDAAPILALAQRLIDGIRERSDWFSALRSEDLRTFSTLIPPKLVARFGADPAPVRLLICPVGILWAVPFAAIPIVDFPLVEHCDIQLSPSVRFHTSVGRWRPPIETPTMSYWVDEDNQDFCGADFEWLQRHAQPLPRKDLIESISRSSADVTVLACHGDDQPGVLHSLYKSDRSTVLRAGDLLATREISPVFVLAACSGGYVPGSDWAEPLGIATAALCAGARLAIGSCLPIGLDYKTETFLCTLYEHLVGGADPGVVSRSQRAWLRKNPNPKLYQWAPMTELC